MKETACRLIADAALLAVLLLLMSDRYTGNTLHEVLGSSLVLLLAWHIVLNRRWFGTRGKGRWNTLHLARAVVVALLSVSVSGAVLTGIMTSQSLFGPFLPEVLQGGLTSRLNHLFFAAWTLVLAGMHCGLHADGVGLWCSFLSAPARSVFSVAGRLLLLVLAAYGIVAFTARQMSMYLAADSAYLFWSEQDSLPCMLLDYAALVALPAVLTCWTMHVGRAVSHGRVRQFFRPYSRT